MTDAARGNAHDLVSIVICTYNRAPDLRITLEAIEGLDWREVIVVDNACTDGTADLLHEFPWVRVIRNDKNVGVPGFTVGVDAARTPYVLLLDDDAIPDADVAARIVDRFEGNPRLGAIACHVVTPDGTVVTGDWPEHPILFWGCGAGIRVDAARQLSPMFYPRLRLHGTELDLCIRLYSAGYHVDYDPESRVVHRFSMTNRTGARRMRTVTYASVRFAWDHLSRRAALRATRRALFHRNIDSFEGLRGWCLGLADLLTDLGDIRSRRFVVPAAIEDAYLAAVWEYQPRNAPRVPLGFPSTHIGG